MERGVYAAATGMLAQQALQETLAQNVANASTVGYKQDTMTFRTIQGMMLRRLTNQSDRGPEVGELGVGVNPDETTIDWQMGSITQTNNPLDVSLAAGQFLTVRTGNGALLTRAGNLQIDGAGNLATSNGRLLMDTNNRPINVSGKTGVSIDARGVVSANQQPIAQLQIVQANPKQLEKEGESFFRPKAANAARPAATPQLRPGTLEQSNANVMQGLVRLITVSRTFEMAQRALTTQDELLKQATMEVGKV